MEYEKIKKELLDSQKKLQRLYKKNALNEAKKTLCVLLTLSPLALTSGILKETSKKMMDDKKTCYYQEEYIMDSNGNTETRYVRSEEDLPNTLVVNNYYTLTDNDNYERNYTIYDISNLTYGEALYYFNKREIPEDVEIMSLGYEVVDSIEDVPYMTMHTYQESNIVYLENKTEEEKLKDARTFGVATALLVPISISGSTLIGFKCASLDIYKKNYKIIIEDQKRKNKILKKELKNKD